MYTLCVPYSGQSALYTLSSYLYRCYVHCVFPFCIKCYLYTLQFSFCINCYVHFVFLICLSVMYTLCCLFCTSAMYTLCFLIWYKVLCTLRAFYLYKCYVHFGSYLYKYYVHFVFSSFVQIVSTLCFPIR